MALELKQRIRDFLGTGKPCPPPIVHTTELAYPPPPMPFVCVLVMGVVADRAFALGRMVTMGGCDWVPRGGTRCIELTPHLPMSGVQVIAFCDLERVGVQVFYGNDLMHGGLGPAPFALIPEVLPGVRISVIANGLERCNA